MIRNEPAGFNPADPYKVPFPDNRICREEELEDALLSLIISPSGLRKIFSPDGDEEGKREDVSIADKLIVATFAGVFCRFIRDKTGKRNPLLIVGTDTRYTGPVIADVVIRVLLAEGMEVRFLSIAAAPEIMAYTRLSKNADGFIYISASHNPIGYNGIKAGLSDGGVVGGEDAVRLIEDFKRFIKIPHKLLEIAKKVNSVPPQTLEKKLGEVAKWKDEAISSYYSFTLEVISGTGAEKEQERFVKGLREKLSHRRVGVVAELNGSARTASIDIKLLTDLGVKVRGINDKPGQIAHPIIPEGESLELCRLELLKANLEDTSFILGYVPDNDGDRGNIVYIDEREKQAKTMDAQEVFALVCMAELAFLVYSGVITPGGGQKVAVVANGPTSLRVERIAELFGADVFRCEVGEANVVNLARKLRGEGYLVRVMGEGSNGGNITHPSAVRDPINTIGSLLKLLVLNTEGERPGLFDLWCRLSRNTERYIKDFGMTEIIDTLPEFVTTPVSSQRAVLKICSSDHSLLKARYREIFSREWEKRKEELRQKFGIYSWTEINYHGIETGTREGKGGFKILFKNSRGGEIGFIWMRGSGTEPVFRVLADIEGSDPARERWLLEWHRRMVMEADGAVQ